MKLVHSSGIGEAGPIADIEMLRGVAILFVLAEHVRHNLFTWTSPGWERFSSYFGGWTGVDIFFAVSGFVIARSLRPKLEARTDIAGFLDTAIAFWVRRAWRLLPAAWLWLGLILVGAAVFNRSGAFGLFHDDFQSAIAAALDLADFRVAPLYGHGGLGAGFPYWSLSLEEQFYLTLPFLVLFSGRRLVPVLLVLVVAQLFLDRPGPMDPLFNLRCDGLLLGVLIAIWSRHPTHQLFKPAFLGRSRFARIAVPVVILAAIGSLGANGPTGFFDGADHIVSFRVGLIALLSAALVAIASFDGDYLCPKGVAGRAMLWLGSRSYALYLTHIPAFACTREIWFRVAPAGTMFQGSYTLRYVLTGGALLILFAEASYRMVETPLRRRGRRIAQRFAREAAIGGLAHEGV